MRIDTGGSVPARWLLAPLLVLLPTLAGSGDGTTPAWSGSGAWDGAPSDQEADQEAPPRLPAGVPVVFLPVQSVGRAPAGGWSEVDGDREAVLERFDDEVGFALRERRSTRAWVVPSRVLEAAGRNPMLDVDPRALAFQGIRNQQDDPLYEPLHGQLRSLTAILDARLVVLPFGLRYEPAVAEDSAADRPDGDREAGGGPRLEVAIVDTRAGRVLWLGTVEGAPAEPGASGMLTELADRLVRRLAPS